MRSAARVLALAAGSGLSPPLAAESVELSGFGTASAYQARGKGVRVRPDAAVSQSAADRQWRCDGDSRLGLQAQWRASEDWELVGQVVIGDDVADRQQPQLTWAYARWAVAPDWTLRFGRQILPTLRQSETRWVAYAQPSVRPPTAVYSLNPGAPVDAIHASWERSTAAGRFRADLGWGQAKVTRPNFRVDMRETWVTALEWQRDDLLLRGSVGRFRFDLSRDPLAGLANPNLCSNCAALAAGPVSPRNIRGTLYGAVAVWTPGAWEWSFEALERPRGSSTLTPAARAWSVLGAWRWESWKPHVAWGQLRFREPAPGLQANAAAPPAVQSLIASLDRFLSSPFDLDTWQLGLRWDFRPGMALKVQRENWKSPRDRTTGRNLELILQSPPVGSTASTWDGRASLTTLSLDFVF